MSRVTILAVSFFLLMVTGVKAESPHWSFNLRGVYFVPEIDEWEDRYGEEGIWMGELEVGRKLTRRLEVSIGLDYAQAEGKASTLTERESSDKVTYNQAPLRASILYRFIFYENQPVVPYLGGGYSHLIYVLELNDRTYSGDQTGYHLRAGLQFLLDYLEPQTARECCSNWKVFNTYLTLEAVYSWVDDFGQKDTNLGGWGFIGGILFEY